MPSTHTQMLAYAPMNRLLAALVALCAGGGVHAATPSSSATPVATTLGPGEPYQSCMTLQAGDKRNYAWKSEGPVDFTLTYRDGDATTTVLKCERMRGDS